MTWKWIDTSQTLREECAQGDRGMGVRNGWYAGVGPASDERNCSELGQDLRKGVNTMKKFTGLAIAAFLLAPGINFAQKNEAPDPYKPILEKLQSLETMQIPEWPYHEDMAHPEAPGVNEAGWPTAKVREEWKTGARVFRRTIEIP